MDNIYSTSVLSLSKYFHSLLFLKYSSHVNTHTDSHFVALLVHETIRTTMATIEIKNCKGILHFFLLVSFHEYHLTFRFYFILTSCLSLKQNAQPEQLSLTLVKLSVDFWNLVSACVNYKRSLSKAFRPLHIISWGNILNL